MHLLSNWKPVFSSAGRTRLAGLAPLSAVLCIIFLCAQNARAQSMPGMQDDHSMHSDKHSITLEDAITNHSSSGTSLEPLSTPASMMMTMRGGWMLMLHGEAFISDIQQSGPRGGDKFFSTNWIMPMAQRDLGPGKLTVRTMLSLEPATVTERRYPELFQIGETAFGRAIVNGQHPHDLFMEIAALYDLRLSEHALLSFYAAPVGDPAIGPTAYPHRTSASEDPIATLGHHLEDSTHIAADVITAGFAYKRARLEASGFHGREPDEYRWNIDQGRLDSYSARLTIAPATNWEGQFSAARIVSPETLAPNDDQLRMTASISYNRPLTRGNWANTVLWGRTRTLGQAQPFNGYLLESTLRFADRNYVWTRIENTDRSTELLDRPGVGEGFLARVQAYTVGYARDVHVIEHADTALGAQVTWYEKPASLTPLYGAQPAGVVMFVRLRLRGKGM
jgi:hypothetical protein